ncbi:MAG: TolC family protein [Bacteroidales bacterium]
MTTRHLIALALICAGIGMQPLWSQNPDARSFRVPEEERILREATDVLPDSLHDRILESNPRIRLAYQTYLRHMAGSRTGLTPPDPSVGVAYLTGDPRTLGTRVDVSLSQEFDFPTAYIHRSRLAGLEETRAGLEYIQVRQEVLLQARLLWLEGVYLRQNQGFLQQRLGETRAMETALRSRAEAGDSDPLLAAEAALQRAAAEGEWADLELRIRNLSLGWAELLGSGQEDALPPWPEDALLPQSRAPGLDSLLTAYGNSPERLLGQIRVEENEKNLDLVRSLRLPSFSAGYFSESVNREAFRGLEVGMSLPLWEDRNKAREAEFGISEAGAALAHLQSEQEKEIRQLCNRWSALEERIATLEEALDGIRSLNLLGRLLEAGEISPSEYFYRSEFHYRNRQLVLDYRLEQLQTEARLRRIYD